MTDKPGKTCGKYLHLIAKVQADLPLSPLDRDIILEALRRYCLTRREWKAFLAQAEAAQYEAAKKIAELVEPRGKSHRWLRRLYGGKKTEALVRYFIRKRATTSEG
jgi:hypothetical protein